MDPAEIDNKTRQAVEAIRTKWFPKAQPSLSKSQIDSRTDAVFRGPLWICPTSLPIDEDDELWFIFLRAIKDFGDIDIEANTASKGDRKFLNVEWNGFRKGEAASSSTGCNQETYDQLMCDTSNETTILYLHGGGYT